MMLHLLDWIPDTNLNLVTGCTAAKLARRYRMVEGDVVLFTNGAYNRARLLLCWPGKVPSVVCFRTGKDLGKLFNAAVVAVVNGCDRETKRSADVLYNLQDEFDLDLQLAA
jgi:hypothetical protein